MLENKILSNHNVSDSKRDVVINQSNQNNTDRKFEDAMYESRQQQLNTEQRQNAARNDHAQQKQRQQQDRYQQDQVKARQESERSAERVNQPRRADDKPSVANNIKKVNSPETNDKVVDKKGVESSSDNTSVLTSSVPDQTSTDTTSDQIVVDENSSEAEKPPIEGEAVNTVDTEVDSISWLDTFMKIVAHNEQNCEHDNEKDTETENQVLKTQTVDTQTLEPQSSTDSIVKGEADKSVSDVLTNFLFGTDSSNAEKITDVDDTKLTETEPTDLTSLLTDKVTKEAVKADDPIKVDITESVKVDITELDSESSEPKNIMSNLLNNTDASVKNDALNTLGTDVNKNIDITTNTDVSNEDIHALQKGVPVFSSSVLQQQVQQELSVDISKQANLIEQGTKTNTVLNFVNPALSEFNKGQKTDSVESNQFLTDFDDELDGMKTNSDGVNTNDKKLDSEFKSILEIKNASLLANGIDGSNKAAEPTNKTDVIDVNGVQLDKSLQLPKLEHSSQAKNEVLLRENILFNKQEMATHMQQQVGIMMSKNMKSIDIRLDPPELGAMQIKLTMNNDQAAVSFVVSNQQAKDALEASLPKLRELLEQQGMDLAESDVQHGNAQGEAGTQDDSDARNNANSLSNDDGQEEANLIAQEKLNRAINSPWNVDYYA